MAQRAGEVAPEARAAGVEVIALGVFLLLYLPYALSDWRASRKVVEFAG